MPRAPLALAGALLVALLPALAPAAQTDPGPIGVPDSRGTAYFVFAEPGAPTIELVVLGDGIRNGIYRIQQGTSFIETLALMGGTARSDSTNRTIVTSTVRVLRDGGGGLRPIYESTTYDILADVRQHPTLMSGDVIESRIETEEIEEPFTFLDGLNVVSRVASVISAFILLYTRVN
ncbi:hypothetical protein [Rubrivirga sp.]|uniref:hypothetical protein n=1 Tax=Rubrivirga sp. TaxID=1885344 RepID=UPI003B5215E0